jgi:hypothetical protein
VIEAIEAGRVEDALALLNLKREFFSPLDDALRNAFIEGGRNAMIELPPIVAANGVGLAIRFDGRNLRGENWLRDLSSTRITEILVDQQMSVRTVLREGLRLGQNPRSTALGIVGRINRVTGRREGGILGLTSQQTGFVMRAKEDLLSGEPVRMAQYLKRTRRDARLDGIVNRAIKDGKPVSAADADRIAMRYSDRLLKLRGDNIARTETLSAMHGGQEEALRQLTDTGGVQPEQVRRTWRTASDARVRDSHAGIDGETVGLDEMFSIGLRFPGDPLGPPEEIINCRCWVETRIDYLGNKPPAGTPRPAPGGG